MDAALQLTLQIVLTVLAGVTAQVVGSFSGIPSIIFYFYLVSVWGPMVLV
jgi:hypothetical protein